MIGVNSKSNMAALSGRKRHKMINICAITVYVLLNLVPCTYTLSVPFEEIKLSVSDITEVGHVVLKSDIIVKECTQIVHVQRSPGTPAQPFTVQDDGTLVTVSSVKDFVGDLFVLSHSASEACEQVVRPVSRKLKPINIEIIPITDVLAFQKDSYTGFMPLDPVYGRKVDGITDLFACQASGCENNIEYNIIGSDNFFLQTYSFDGHIQLSIHARGPLANNKQSEKFTIVGENSHGQRGHTNVEIRVIPNIEAYDSYKHLDSSLYFKPHHDETNIQHRLRRQTDVDEILAEKQVSEKAQGVVFNVTIPGNSNYRYALTSSTYEDAFTVVATTGVVSVAQGFTLDYETFVPENNNSARFELKFTVTDNSKQPEQSGYSKYTYLIHAKTQCNNYILKCQG